MIRPRMQNAGVVILVFVTVFSWRLWPYLSGGFAPLHRGTFVTVRGRVASVFRDFRPEHAYAVVRWLDDSTESGLLPTSSLRISKVAGQQFATAIPCANCVALATNSTVSAVECMSKVVYAPKPHPLRKDPVVIFEVWRRSVRPQYTVIVPVHNKGDLIDRVLTAFLRTTRGDWELVVVIDGSVDNSTNVVLQTLHRELPLLDAGIEGCAAPSIDHADKNWFVQKTRLYQMCKARRGFVQHCGNLVHVRVLWQETGVWEASSDNLGACVSQGSFIVLAQDDMYMTQIGWNIHLALPMIKWSDVISVSARCAHDMYGGANGHLGKCDGSIQYPSPKERWFPETFHVRDTTNRGPLMYHAAKLRTMGYLDETHFFADSAHDEHDLHHRAWKEHEWVTGLYEMDFYNELDWGGLRRGFNKKQGTNGFKSLDDENTYKTYRLGRADGLQRGVFQKTPNADRLKHRVLERNLSNSMIAELIKRHNLC